MAEKKTTTASTPRTRKTSTARATTVEKPVEKLVETPVETPVVEQPTVWTTKKPASADVDIHQFITVINGFQGRLTYRSKRTGELFVWENFGDTQDIELLELKSAKSASKRFFSDNWFMFSEEDNWVPAYLGLEQYYRDALPLDDFETLFEMKPEEVKDIVSKLSPGQKKSLGYLARRKIAENEIDSMRVISALEDALGIELVEK